MAEICISIAAKVAELLVDPIVRQISYAFKYQRNMEELKKQVKKLTDERESVQHSVDEAKRQGDEIEKHVQEWLESVDEFAEKVAKPIIDDQVKVKKLCSIGFCPSLMTRYSLSKKAVKTAKDGVDLLGEGKFQKVSYRLPPRRANSINIRGYEDFASRMSLSKSIMEALADADANLIGVYGMGGVGKTTLVKKVAQQAKENKLFDLVVTAVVTETPDIRKIQGQIADELGLKFQEESLPGRAARLCERMKKENRILVILDNVWAKLDLESIGIPVGGDEKGSTMQKVHKEGETANKWQCKILLTSRRLDVLHDDMDIQKNFKVEVLSDPEGESLFWTTVGCLEEKSDLNPIAVEIVGKCGGLPVAITTIANALKNKSLPSWKTARDQLKKANPKTIRGMNEDVYSTIELSFNFLEGEEAKSLFLLCSLCNDGYRIHIDYLLRYGMGLGLFQDFYTLEGGRNKLHSLIDDLKTSCMLMDHEYDSNYVKMHDVIHAVAASISSTTKLWFNLQDAVGLKEVLEKKLPKDSVAISLFNRDIYELPEKIEFPKLELFLLCTKDASLQIPDAVFEGMKGLKVLDISGIHMLSPPSSLRCLINLHTLCLDGCQLKDVAIIGELKELEILTFFGSDIKRLPGEIGQLTRLRLLDLSHCSKLKVIEPNVLSSLTHLEELYMGDSFDQWDIDGQRNASLAELKQLSNLTALDIHVPNAQIIPQGLSFEKLERYRIFVGEVWDWFGKYETSRTLKLKWSSSIYLSNEIKSLLNRTQDVHLDKLKGVKNVVYELNGEGFPQLKHLHVQNGSEIQHIANLFGCGLCNVFPRLESLFLDNLINLEKICHGPLATNSFSKLRIMKVRKCDRLKHLFSFSMVNNLLQLQEIEVTNCKKLEEIISKENMDLVHQNESIRRIVFTRLHTLTLKCLPQLTSFSFNASTPDIGSQEIVAEDEADAFMSLFSQNVVLPSLKNLKLSSINIRCTWLDQLPVISSCCQALTNLTLEECNNLKFLFSYSIVQSFVQLQKLEIRNCKSIEEIISSEELRGKEKVNMMVFPKLLNLQLKGLPKLSRFGSRNSVEFRTLTQISIQDCPNLKTFFSSSKYVDIIQSKEIEEMNCQDDVYPLFDEKVMLPTLASINLSSIPIRTIWHNQLRPMSSCFQNLKEIIMDGCDTVKYGLPSSMVESLVQLEVLEISNCKLMEVVTITAGERINNTLFTKLHRLHLKHLPELTTFCNFAGKLIELTSLAQLWLENCPKMHAFVSNSPRADLPVANEEQMNSEKNLQYSHIQPFFDEKVQILDLKFLVIKKMDNMRKIWCHQLIMDSFSKIDSFKVYNCHNLQNIFPSNMLGRLQKLAVLEVSDCKSVEVIFEELNTTEEDVETVPRFVFPQLTSLLLSDLPSLRSFYPGLYISEWPKLNKLRMWGCNKVEILTSEYSSFEKSHGGSQLENSIQEQLFIVDKVAFPKIEHLALEWNWIVKEILHRNFSKYSCHLKVVELIRVSKQSGICPCCFLCTLTNLERLDVYYGFFEEIFTHEELDCKKKHAETPSKLNQLRLFYLEDSLLQWEEDSLPCKVFRNLTSLKVLKCHDLKNLAPCFVSIQNLKKLEVSCCDGLVNLMEVSVAKSLVQLTRLKISECKMIEGIIMHGVDEVENQMIFNQLEYLELHSLPKLTSFCSGNCNIEFPSLQQIVVRQCPTMENFSQGALSTPKLQKIQTAEVDDEGSWEGGLNTTIQKLFKDMIGFRGLQHLTTSEFPHLKEVWHGQFPVKILCNLKSLVMDDCANISSAISANLLLHLNSLEKLHVRNGDSLVEVFNLEELNADGDLKVLSQLSEFFLADLPRLEHIWKKNHSEVLGFRNLKLMKVYNCSNLRYIFTPSVVLGLMQLQELEIKNCAIMEEIITMEGENDAVAIGKITFLQLNCLVMDSLPNLTSFYSGSNTLECPSLTTININDCPKMETFVFTHLKDCCTGIAPLFGEKVELPSLASLFLRSIASQTIWHNQLQAHSACFRNLTDLFIDGCHNLKYLFPFSVSENLNHLEDLHISDCKLMEGVITTQGERKSSTLFPKLKELNLDELPELIRFCNFNGNSIELPSLSELIINDCPKMQTFASNSLPGIEEPEEVNTDTEENLPSFFDEKVSFSCLKKLTLSDLPELLHLWKKNSQPSKVFENLSYLRVSGCSNLKTLVPSPVSLQNLETLEVQNCDGLISLVTFSTATSLEQLKRMEIIGCKLIEEIIIDTGHEIKDVIVFNQLEYLKLRDLPSLTSFCKGNFTIEFPYLQRVLVIECLKMMNFSQGVLSTPKLKSLKMTESSDEWKWVLKWPKKFWEGEEDKEDKGCWEGDLNTTVQKVFRDMDGFRYTKNFTVSDFPHLKELWHEKFLVSYFSNLKSLVVDDKYCSLRYIFTPSLAMGLAQLQDLEIKNCVILEVITVIGEETISNTMFPNLNSLELINLPNLTCFCNFAENSIELPSLTRLSIENCPNMETFISNFLGVDMSTSKDNCDTDIQPLFDEKVQLLNLKFLRLDKMDKLRKIWHHQLSSDSFSKLYSFRVHNCHNVLNVIPSNMLGRLQKLVELWLINCSSLCEIFELQASSCGKTQAITATPLEKLVLEDLPKLKHIWDVDSQGLLTCQNLISIEVEGCDSLKSIFPASVGRNLLRLEELCIEKCCMVEEIFAKEEQVDEAVPRFPRLTFLRLAELPRLQSFYPRVHISEWPVLKKLHVWKCDRIEIFVSNFLSFQVNQGESQQEKPTEQPLLLLDKVPFNNLESLTLDWKWIEKESLHEKLPMYSCKLKVLTFVGFHNEANICISCFLPKLPDLERLQVRQGFFKEIFSFKGFGCEEKHVDAPSKLSILWLFDLFDSLHLWEENSLSGKVFQNLRILEVIKCGNLKCLVPSSVSFKNLKTLEVSNCKGLLNLVAALTAKSMMQLTKLSISECERIEEIIIHEGDEVEDIIIFKKLSYLELQCLPSLTSFYSGNCITEFPSLKQLVVRECPNMKTFSQGVLRAPRLYGLQITETAEGKGYWKGNLNTTIEHLFTENGQSSKED